MQTVLRRLDKETVKMEALVYQIGETGAKKVFSRALNHEARKANTQVKRQIRKQTSIKLKDVSRGVKLKLSNHRNLRAEIRASGRPFALGYFRPRQFSYGVAATVWGRRQKFPHAFLVASISGQVFKNTRGFNEKSKRNNAIERMWGPSLPKELLTNSVTAQFYNALDDVTPRALHELKRFLEKA